MKMRRAAITANFNSDIQKVWDVVTDNLHIAWRSDLNKIEVFNGGLTFVEYTKNDLPTTCTVTLKKPAERYEFDIKSFNMSGHWTGIFSRVGEGSRVEFIEEVYIENPIMNLFGKIYLNGRQTLYVKDLRKALGE